MVAVWRTSTGDPICVSFRFAAPPAASGICVYARDQSYACVMVAHGDSVLFDVGFHGYDRAPECFAYSASNTGAMPPRPPSLYLLPPCYHGADEDLGTPPGSWRGPWPRFLHPHLTVLTRRGHDDFVVAFLGGVEVCYDDRSGELLLLRHGEWVAMRPVIITGEGKRRELRRLSSWEPYRVLSIGDDELMCWVDFRRGLMLTNVFDETPTLRYVPVPQEEEVERHSCRRSSQDLCITSDGTVRFVRVSPRCCCGSSGATHCRHSKNTYTIRTWTLEMDGMAWVMDGMVDATELWALDAYKSLLRIQLAYPIVSLDEPHVIYFRMCERFVKKHGNKTVWLILVDMRSKTMRSVCRYDEGDNYFSERVSHPSSVSDYFNSSPSCTDGASLMSASTMDSKTPWLAIAKENLTDNASNSEAPEETILAVLQEVPGLAREDMLKAYSVLSHDSNGRRFRSLLGLPVSLMKDWLLMEIKTSEACSVCSACTAN